jgi:hypothetical protein
MIQSAFLLVVVWMALSRTHYETGRIEMSEERKEIFVGIDLHKRRWHVTVQDADLELLIHLNLPTFWRPRVQECQPQRMPRIVLFSQRGDEKQSLFLEAFVLFEEVFRPLFNTYMVSKPLKANGFLQ